MSRSHRSKMMRWLLLPLAVLAVGCTDQDLGIGPVVPADEEAHLRIHVALATTTVTRIAVEVTAADIEPLAFELVVEDGAASGTIAIPAGSARTITLRAFDGGDIETHRGSRTVDIEGGSNPEIAITLDPLTGEQPIEAVLGEVVLVGVSPEDLIFLRDDSVQLTAHVEDSDGNPVDVPVRWAVVQPSLVEVSVDGVARLTDPSVDSHTATVVAALGTQVRSTQVTFMSSAGVVGLIDQELHAAFLDWWQITSNPNHGAPALSAMTFQHSTQAANFSMIHYSAIPRPAIVNDPAFNSAAQYWVFSLPFEWAYRAIAAVNRAYADMDHFMARDMFDPADEPRVRALGSYLQGISYGSLALRFDGGPLLGDHTELDMATEFTDYVGLLGHALELLDETIALASAHSMLVSESLMRTSEAIDAEVLARVAHSYSARLRTGVARTPAERAAVDWAAVLSDIENGVLEDFGYIMVSPEFTHLSLWYTTFQSWSQMNYFVHGMADQSGRFQEWMSLPVDDRHPELPGGSFLINTPDLRFPQGESLGDQMGSPGSRFVLPSDYASRWSSPDRGTWRWSFYRTAFNPDMALNGFLPDLTLAEMRLLAAEAYVRMGNPAQAASLVNMTRVAAGLNPTDAEGTNTSCVPRLPDGSCGDLFEMIKWEKRLEASHTHAGYLLATWYYDGRGWGDLMEGTALQWPVPAHFADQFGLPVRAYGGGLDYSAPVGTYGY